MESKVSQEDKEFINEDPICMEIHQNREINEGIEEKNPELKNSEEKTERFEENTNQRCLSKKNSPSTSPTKNFKKVVAKKGAPKKEIHKKEVFRKGKSIM